MHRFFLKPEDITGHHVTFPHDTAHQIIHVLRLGEGDHVAVLDNLGHVHRVRLGVDAADVTLTGEIVETNPVRTEPQLNISLYFGLSNREKVEWILQKGTEVGISAFFPFVSSRTLVQSLSLTTKKLTRWERIIKEAAEQSRRGRLPVIDEPKIIEAYFSDVGEKNHLCLIAWENARAENASLPERLEGFTGDSIALFVGPEGGFSEEEVNQAQKAGCQVVSLGARTLRMETAAIIFPALVLYELRA